MIARLVRHTHLQGISDTLRNIFLWPQLNQPRFHFLAQQWPFALYISSQHATATGV